MKLNAMGFACASCDKAAATLAQLAQKATHKLSCSKGEYRRWESTAGAQLWFHFPHAADSGQNSTTDATDTDSPQSQAMGMTPFHRGQSSVRILVGRAQMPDKLNPLEGNIRATLRSPDAVGLDPQLRLEMVPFALQRRSRRPFLAGAQLVGFAADVLAFDTAEDYMTGVAPRRLIAPGAMTSVRESEIDGLELGCNDNDHAMGLVTGRIERAVHLVNPETKLPYYWLVLKADVGLIDIVTSPDAVTGDISQGHIAQVCASFVGRLLDTPMK